MQEKLQKECEIARDFYNQVNLIRGNLQKFSHPLPHNQRVLNLLYKGFDFCLIIRTEPLQRLGLSRERGTKK